MKRTFLSLLPFTIAITLGLTSCSDSDTPEEPNPDGPYGGMIVDYNINDYKITDGSNVYEPITSENWRHQGSMFLYVGSNGADASIKDTENRTGYRLVNLPWAEGTVESNLPIGFCHDIIPENGWEWVYNLCGNRSTENGNFFAVYNKYSGILRFFFYMPSHFSAGNDHYWRVITSDHLAQSSVWRYGLPADRNIVDKSAIGQTAAGVFTDYVTPWVIALSDDNHVVPNAGWWAFDVDMSQTRADKIMPNDVISLQMCSWNTQHVSLASTIAANIDGSLQAKFDITKTTVSTAKGFTESLGDIARVGGDAYSAVSAALEGNAFKALTSAFSFARGAYSVYGAMTKETEVITDTIGKGTITGSITMALNGTINTEGVIQGSAPVTGINPVTIRMENFDMEHSHLGQGTWNLKVTPIVYRMPFYIKFTSGYDFSYMWPYVFNPNSIEVELNPILFPEEDIEWMQVDALCVSRKGMNDMSNDNIRKAFGLQSCSKKDLGLKHFGTFPDYKSANPIANFIYAWDGEDVGVEPGNVLIYEVTEGRTDYGISVTLHNEVLGGAGAGDACIEPVYEWCAGYDDPGDICRVPFLEVNVQVLVKMKGMDKPILYCRNYLPEFKDWDAAEYERSIQAPKPYADKMAGRNQLREYQNKRIREYCNKVGDDSFHKFVCTDGSVDNYIFDEYRYSSLFDGDPGSYWQALNAGGIFFVEFYARNPLHVASYTLSVVNLEDGKYNPKSWKLYARNSQDGEWTLIDERSDQQLPTTPLLVSETYQVSNNDTWKYFRFEVTELAVPGNYLWGTSVLRIGELELNGD